MSFIYSTLGLSLIIILAASIIYYFIPEKKRGKVFTGYYIIAILILLVIVNASKKGIQVIAQSPEYIFAEKIIGQIEDFKKETGKFPISLTDLGFATNNFPLLYSPQKDGHYIVSWNGASNTALKYYSSNRSWK